MRKFPLFFFYIFKHISPSALTCLAELSDVSPGIVADALEAAPELLALGSVATGRWDAGGLAVLDNLRQMHRHVAVDVQNLAVDHQAPEAANEPGLY